MRSRNQGLISVASIALLAACAHSPMTKTPADDKDIAVSEQVGTRVSGPYFYSQDQFPNMTPEELGRRFLRFIDSLERYDQLTLEHLEQTTQLTLIGPESGRFKQFSIHMPALDWYYAIGYSEDKDPPHYASATLNFQNRTDSQADMTPVCAVDFDAYTSALEKMGFVYRKDLELYDVGPMVPFTNERGETEYRTTRPERRLSPYAFSRSGVMVSIFSRSESEDRSSSRRGHACVERMVVGPVVQRP